jgi:hypothetical protein
VIWSGLAFALLVSGAGLLGRRRPVIRWVVAHGVAFMAVTQAAASADFRVNGSYLDTPIPFQDGAFLRGTPEDFQVPSQQRRDALRQRVENDVYRSVLICDRDSAPTFCAAHVSYFWNLRVVEGYTSGVPTRVVSLPWPRDAVSLRAISFTTADQLPWPLLAMLNVKYAVRVDGAFYRNRFASDSAVAAIEANRSPFAVTPRAFFAASVVPVPDLSTAVKTLFPPSQAESVPDVVTTSVVEGLQSPAAFSTEGEISADFNRGTVNIRVTPTSEPRFLVVNDLFHPRWRAFSSSVELTVYPTNAAMRGVFVPAGADSVRFEYVPAYRTATAVPAAGFGLAILMFALNHVFWGGSKATSHGMKEASL